MPDRFGNPTPLEVLARVTQERDAILNAPAASPQEMRLANIDAIAKMVFAGQDPRMLKAKDIDRVMQRSMSTPRGQDESQLDYEIRTGRQAMNDMVAIDPTTAAAISEHLTKLEEMRLDRQRLQARETREVDEHKWAGESAERERAAQRTKDLTDGLLYEVNPQTGVATGATVYTTDPDYLVTAKEVTDRKNMLLTADQVAGLIDTKAADMSLMNNSDFSTLRNQVTGAHDTAVTADRLMQAFIEASKEGINTQTYYQKLERLVEGVVESTDEAFRAANDGQGLPAVGSKEFEEDRAKAAKWLQGRQLPAGVTESTLVRLAYTWAKSFDNRVTEQDFQNAYKMLAGNSGNPAIVANTIRAATFERRQQLTETVGAYADDILRLAPPESEPYMQATLLRNSMGRYKGAVDSFDSNSQELMRMWGAKPSGTGSASGVPTAGGRRIVRGGQ